MSPISTFFLFLAWFGTVSASLHDVLTQHWAQTLQVSDQQRHSFYIAHSLKSLGYHQEALPWIQFLLEVATDQEIVWMAKMMFGECYDRLQEPSLSLKWYSEAYEDCPERKEPLVRLASLYHRQHHHVRGHDYAEKAALLSDKVEGISFDFSLENTYKYDAHVAATSSDWFKELNRLNEVALNRSIPLSEKEEMLKQLIFYAPVLQDACLTPLEIELPRIRGDASSAYRPLNPSIQKSDSGYELIVRTVNYHQYGGVEWGIEGVQEDRRLNTRNLFIRLDRDFNLISQKEIIDRLPFSTESNRYQGLEDCRLFSWKGAKWFTCTNFKNSYQALPKIALCRLGREKNDTYEIEIRYPFKGPIPERVEKNWLPFIKEDQLHFIYSYDPFVVLKPDFKSGVLREVVFYPPPVDGARFRGSAGPIPFEEGYLLVVHESMVVGQRYYTHRFIYLDRDCQLQKISHPFIFQQRGIEFCCGMTIDHAENNLLLTLGVEDRQAYLCRAPLSTIGTLLKPLPNYNEVSTITAVP